MSIVRICKRTGDVRPSDRAEVERIIWLNYEKLDAAMKHFEEGNRIESPFAYYEIRHDDSAFRTPHSALEKEAA